MTTEQIAEYKQMSMEYHIDMPRRQTEERVALRIRLNAYKCDHKLPDGSSAFSSGGMFHNHCSICQEIDN